MGAHCPATHWNIPEYLYEYGMPDVKPMEGIIFIVAQKRRDIPFVVPVDTPTGPSWPRQTVDLINKWQSGRIFIYGAGGLGALVAAEFRKLGLEINAFIDTFKSGMFEERPVHKFEDYVVDRRPDDRILIASLYDTEIRSLLREHGYGWVASIREPWCKAGL
jgi:hypothetical protein